MRSGRRATVWFALVLLLAATPLACGGGDRSPVSDEQEDRNGSGAAIVGFVTADFGGGQGIANDVAVQADGSIVVAGIIRRPGAFVARFLPDGRLDRSFGRGGSVTPSGDHGVRLLASGRDGSLLVAGWVDAGDAGRSKPGRLALSRYSSDGRQIEADVGPAITVGPAPLPAFALQPDGSVVSAGSVGAYGATDFALARYLPDGRLDRTFGSAGTVVTNLGDFAESIWDVALQRDGRIVAAGVWNTVQRGHALEGPALALARYTADGRLDRTFGSKGIVRAGSAGPGVTGVVIQPDGKIIVGEGFVLRRYLPEGRPDPTFGTNGTAVGRHWRVGVRAGGIALQEDGKLVVAGTWLGNGNPCGHPESRCGPAIERYTSAGRLDATFGDRGRVISHAGLDTSAAVALAPDGKIVVVGSTLTEAFEFDDVALLRLTADGRPDPTFTGGH